LPAGATNEASSLAARVLVAPDAPLFIVMNSGSGKHEGEDVRVVISKLLGGAGRSFSLHEVESPGELHPGGEPG
jgi:hypothetical protein